MMGSIDFATKLKITPQTLIPGFGNFYRAALLIDPARLEKCHENSALLA